MLVFIIPRAKNDMLILKFTFSRASVHDFVEMLVETGFLLSRSGSLQGAPVALQPSNEFQLFKTLNQCFIFSKVGSSLSHCDRIDEAIIAICGECDSTSRDTQLN
jgi:hypothetical protein